MHTRILWLCGKKFRVRLADWTRDREALLDVRYAVFVREQNVPEELEIDAIDPHCAHALAEDATGHPIGTGRLLPDGHIGRLAVRRDWRGRGVGGAILQRLMELARERGHRVAVLSAQTHAIAFYERYGFAPYGEIYEDAGILHRDMKREL